MSEAAFSIHRSQSGVLDLSGILGFTTVGSAYLEVKQILIETRAITVLNLAGLRSTDSAGLACLLAWRAEAQQRGRQLELRGLPDNARALAQVCEVEGLLTQPGLNGRSV
ncbi:MAG TPA: STAS domain-containing protein [Mizugakiibacter sp.]|nr:STAS domain-containing protein [Mizugakiibacter sp.]